MAVKSKDYLNNYSYSLDSVYTLDTFPNNPLMQDIPILAQQEVDLNKNLTESEALNLKAKYSDVLNTDIKDFNLFDKNTSAALLTLRGLVSVMGGSHLYDYYKRQERDSIRAARLTAQTIRSKGAQELRNLRFQNEQELGANVNKLAGKRGNLSGSNLDVIMMRKKQQIMDENTLMHNTELQAENTLRNGYLSAASVAMQAGAKYSGNKWKIIGSVLGGLEKYYNIQNTEKAQEWGRLAQKKLYAESVISQEEAFKKVTGDEFRNTETVNPDITINTDTRVTGSLLNVQNAGVFESSSIDLANTNRVLEYISFN